LNNPLQERKVRFFTLCARQDLAQAAVLCESLARHHPDARLTIWLLDAGPLPDAVGASSSFTRPIHDCLSEDTQHGYWLRYDIPEILDVIKPYCFAKHFEEDQDELVIYIDTSTCIYGPCTDLLELARAGAAGVLVPRFMEPISAPIATDQERRVFDLGLLMLRASPAATAFLHWWRNWFESAAHDELGNEMAVFLQQINSAPYLWPELNVLRHKGYQVTSWNIAERPLAVHADDGRVMAGDVPLVSLHVGRFDSSNAERLSSGLDTLDAARHPILASLMTRYRRETLARGFSACRQLRRPGLAFTDGVRLDWVCYHAYRSALKRGITFESVLGSGPGSFREWLCKYPIGGTFPRYVEALFELRPDVKAAYEHDALEAVLRWMKTFGTQEMSLEPNVLQRSHADHPQDRPLSYLGYVTSEVGVGEAARGYIAALQQQGYTLDLVDISDTLSHKQDAAHLRQARLSGVLEGGIKILHVNADSLPTVVGRIPAAAQQNAYHIGIWAWEAPEFPKEWQDRFDLIDELWVASQFMARAIAPKAPVPVLVVPYVINTPDAKPDRQFFGLHPDEFVFLLSFDFFSVMERKNPLGALKAFAKAFTPDEPVRLFVKSMHGDRFLEQYALLKEAAAGSRVTLYDGTLTSAQRFALLSSCDAYLSLHRAEGFGLGLAESMALGKPVVATGWSGNTDFTTYQNSVLVNFELGPLAANAGPYKAGTIWAEPDIDDAAAKMRQLFLDEGLRSRLGEQARKDIQVACGVEAVGKLLKGRLTLLEERQSKPARQNRSTVIASPDVAAAEPALAKRPAFTGRSNMKTLRRVHRALNKIVSQ